MYLWINFKSISTSINKSICAYQYLETFEKTNSFLLTKRIRQFPFNDATPQVVSLSQNPTSYQQLSSPVGSFQLIFQKHITLKYVGNGQPCKIGSIWKMIEQTPVPSCSHSLLVAIDLRLGQGATPIVLVVFYTILPTCASILHACFKYMRLQCINLIHRGKISGTPYIYIRINTYTIYSTWAFESVSSIKLYKNPSPFPVKIAKTHRLFRSTKRHWVSLSGTSASSLSGRNGVQISGR